MSGRVVRAYAALGDSFTAGRDSIEAERWSDLLAAGMRRVNPELRYENFAVDGATSGEVLEDQVGPALALEPDLISVICGANDVLLATRPDVEGYARSFDAILGRLRSGAPEAKLVTATAPEGWQFMDLRPLGDREGDAVAVDDAGDQDLLAFKDHACSFSISNSMPSS